MAVQSLFKCVIVIYLRGFSLKCVMVIYLRGFSLKGALKASQKCLLRACTQAVLDLFVVALPFIRTYLLGLSR